METKKYTWADLFREGRAVYTISLTLAISLHAMDAFIVSTVMPSVVREIGGAQFYTWVVMLYMTASIVGAASGAPVRLILGTRKGYVGAGLVFLAGTILASLAPNMGTLLVARVVQGLGAGLIVSQNTALISELFPGNLRTRMIAMNGMVWATAAVFGPTVGGLFDQLGMWRGAFWFAIPIIIGFTFVAARAIPEGGQDAKRRRFPIGRVTILGAGVLVVAISGVVDALPLRILALVAGLAIIWSSFRTDRNATNKIFPSKPFSFVGAIGPAYWVFVLIVVAPVCVGTFMPLTYRVVYGRSPGGCGFGGASLALAWSTSGILTAGANLKWQRIFIVVGPALAGLGILGIGISVGNLAWQVVTAFQLLAGLGIGMSMSHLMNWTMTMAAPGEESITASSIHTVRSLGIAVAAASAGLVANLGGLGDGISVDSVIRAVSWVESVGAIAPLSGALIAAVLVGHRRRRIDDPQRAALGA
ncbi:MAG: MFS transporter [Alphaproteobacteria bacterium]